MGAFRNIVGTVIGTRIASEASSTGLIGVIAGLAATRLITRSPLGALVVGGGYIAHKLLQKKQKVHLVGPHDAAVDDGLVDGRNDVAALPGAKPARSKATPGTTKAIAAPARNPVPTKGP